MHIFRLALTARQRRRIRVPQTLPLGDRFRAGPAIERHHPSAWRGAALLAFTLTLGIAGPALASGGPEYVAGVVFTRGLVLGPNNQPIYAEFDEQGVARSISSLPNGGELTGELAESTVMDGDSYRAIEQAFNAYLDENQDGIAQGASIMLEDVYRAVDLGSVEIVQAEGQPPLQVPIPKVALLSSSKSALIRANSTISDPAGLGERGVILFEAPIDLTAARVQSLDPDIRSLVLDGQGRVLYASTNNIGLRAAYVRPQSGTGDPSQDHISAYNRGETLWGAVDGAMIQSTLGGFTATDDGRFTVIDFLPPCPGFSVTYDYEVYADLPYRNFDPQAAHPWGSYNFRGFASETCIGYGEVPLGFSLTAQAIQLALIGIDATAADPLTVLEIPIDIVLFNGVGRVANPDGSLIGLGPMTKYNPTVATYTNEAPIELDINLDRNLDWISQPGSVLPAGADILGPEYVGVWLGTTGQYGYDDNGVPLDVDGNPLDPDLYRLADQIPDFEDRGLLESISIEDMADTDIYVFRRSNGQLVVSQEGLSEAEVIEEQGQFRYQLTIPGPRSSFALNSGSSVEAWQQEQGVVDALQGFSTDSLRPGEQVRIIAINRPTGYIASLIGNIESPADGFLDFPLPTLEMKPPNLRISVERMYTVEHGATAGQEREYLIGSEGSGLSSDTFIAVFTEWLDQDGTPLPPELEGYTARLAQIGGTNQLVVAAAAGVEFFTIRPGRNIQLVKLQGDVLGTEHFYVHVNGAKPSTTADFSEGDGTGALQYRPSRYTPVKVPVYDEAATRSASNAAAYAAQEGNPIGVAQPSVYRWPYRPEMQFSVHQLDISRIERFGEDGEVLVDAQGQAINLLEQSIPTLSASDSALMVFYDLLSNQFDPLEFFGPGPTLTFGLSGYELATTTGTGQNVSFDTLRYLNALDPSNLLALSLFDNADAANLLWEFALFELDLAVDLNRDGEVEFFPNPDIQLSDKTTPDRPFRFWLNNDYDVVNRLGESQSEEPFCDPKTDDDGLQICEQWDDTPGATVDDMTITPNNISPQNIHRIESERDLEDFAALALRVNSIGQDGTIEIPQGLQLTLRASGFSINLFKGLWTKGQEYLLDADVLREQTMESANHYLFELREGEEHIFSQAELARIFDQGPVAKLIFEGTEDSPLDCAEDSTHCFLELAVKDGNETVESTRLYLNIYNIKHYYDHFTAGTGTFPNIVGDIPVPTETPIDQHAAGSPSYEHKFISVFGEDEEIPEDYILFVHGWRMLYPERVSFTETTFKRLYWMGYKGRFGGFTWPTGYHEKPAHVADTDQVPFVIGHMQNYNRSEFVARHSGLALSRLASDLDIDHDLHIVAHSMGNVVTSEALRILGFRNTVTSYAASQAATVGGAYDGNTPDMVHSFILDFADFPFFCVSDMMDPATAWECYNSDSFGAPELDMPPDKYRFAVPEEHVGFSAYDEAWRGGYYLRLSQWTDHVRMVNLFSGPDAALAGWEINQLSKPDGNRPFQADGEANDEFGYDFSWVDSCIPIITCDPLVHRAVDEFARTFVEDEWDELLPIDDLFWDVAPPLNQDSRYIISHILPARTHALGQTAVGGLSNNVNLEQAVGFTSSNYDHSAQWQSTFVHRRPYWDLLLTEFRITLE